MPRPNERTYAEINIAALNTNLEVIKARCRGKKIIAVLKDSCYGHGDALVQHISAKIDGIGVSTCEEGYRMRAYCPNMPIIVFGYVPMTEAGKMLRAALIFTVYSVLQARELNAVCARKGKKARVHLKINTGMNRLGLSDSGEILEVLGLECLEVCGIYSHYAVTPDGDPDFFALQTRRFENAVKFFFEHGGRAEFVHICNSAAIGCEAGNAIRVGYALYGYGKGLLPALTWKARIIKTFAVKKGESVGYGRTFTAERNMRLATVAVGYGDGFPRSASNVGCALFEGKRLPIAGNVCMDMTMLDVTDSGARAGAYVTLIGESGKEKLTAEDLGFGYEVLCNISERVPRRYV